jgi:hypothetical protein
LNALLVRMVHNGVVAELGLPEDSRGRHGRVSVSA